MESKPVPPSGDPSSPFWIVGEAPGATEESLGAPFVGASGKILDGLLRSAGISRDSTYILNVCPYRPPDNDMGSWISSRKLPPSPDWPRVQDRWVHPRVAEGIKDLQARLSAGQPKVILALGNTAMWALTGKWGIGTWRGSHLSTNSSIVIPTFHPAAVMRQWDLHVIAGQDVRRAARALVEGPPEPPKCTNLLAPSFSELWDQLQALGARLDKESCVLAIDIETLRELISCIGIVFLTEDTYQGISIPFYEPSRVHYWTFDEEMRLKHFLRYILMHPNALIVGHNFSYDIQYISNEFGIWPRVFFDTIVAQHTIYPGLQKSLAFCASLYCDYYVYWKDDGKTWKDTTNIHQLWAYNLQDCLYTYKVFEALRTLIPKTGKLQVFDFQMNHLYPAVNKMASRGFRVDRQLWRSFRSHVAAAQKQVQEQLTYLLGQDLNIRSLVQMRRLFYDDLGFKPRLSKTTQSPTLNDEALTSIADEEPILKPIIDRIKVLRTLGVFERTFLAARFDVDGRMRSSYSIVGTETFRFSSSESPYGTGMNMQNIPKSWEEPLPGVRLPNLRELFIADPGYLIYDVDLQSADAQVVAALAEDQDLLEAYSQGLDVHLLNAATLFKLNLNQAQLKEGTPENQEAKSRYKRERFLAKTCVHATNYGASPTRIAKALGISKRDAEEFQERWFSAHPGIHRWHEQVKESLHKTRTVHNPFGYSRTYFDRLDSIFPQALAWIPQSTVACVINRALVNVERDFPEIQLLVQVHDSLVFQAPNPFNRYVELHKAFLIPIPFKKAPLIIEANAAAGPSWGNLRPIIW